MSIRGFDCSHNNGNLNWDKLSPDFKFVYIKASQGKAFHDSLFQTNWKTARDKGLFHGAYHFLTATDSAQEQVDNFLNRGIDWTLPNVLPPCLDFEDQVPASLNVNITKNKTAFIKLITDWINIVEAETGRKVLTYSYKNFFAEYLNNHAWPDNPLWLASYQPTPPGLPVGYKDWMFWQNSQFGKLTGELTGGDIDTDIFNGTLEQLNTL